MYRRCVVGSGVSHPHVTSAAPDTRQYKGAACRVTLARHAPQRLEAIDSHFIPYTIEQAPMTRRFDDLMLGSLELFCLAAEHGSFTLAAQAAGLNPAAVSRTIARLEDRLGVRLFVRTTRRIHLTEGGRTYFEHCRQALSLMRDAESRVTGEQQAPSGLLRISVASPYGHYRVLPLLARFRSRYTQVEFEVHMGNRNIDFTAEDFDLAIRGRKPPDATLIARKLEDAELVLVA